MAEKQLFVRFVLFGLLLSSLTVIKWPFSFCAALHLLPALVLHAARAKLMPCYILWLGLGLGLGLGLWKAAERRTIDS